MASKVAKICHLRRKPIQTKMFQVFLATLMYCILVGSGLRQIESNMSSRTHDLRLHVLDFYSPILQFADSDYTH